MHLQTACSLGCARQFRFSGHSKHFNPSCCRDHTVDITPLQWLELFLAHRPERTRKQAPHLIFLNSWSDLLFLLSYIYSITSESIYFQLTDTMLFNASLASLALFSILIIVHSSPVPNDGVALLDISRRSDITIFGRDTYLGRRQRGGAGGAGGAAGAVGP